MFSQSPNTQVTFQAMPGHISCAGVTRSVGITLHACITKIAGLNLQCSRAWVAEVLWPIGAMPLRVSDFHFPFPSPSPSPSS